MVRRRCSRFVRYSFMNVASLPACRQAGILPPGIRMTGKILEARTKDPESSSG